MTATSTTTRRRKGEKGMTKGSAPTIYIGDDASFHIWRADGGAMHVAVSDGNARSAGTICLTSDKGEAAFLAALAEVSA